MSKLTRKNRPFLSETVPARHFLVVAFLAAFFPLFCGCVQRRMTIRSNPPGALVYVDDYEIGVTPVSTNFTYYGTRKIRLVKDGFETLTVMQPIRPPWYQIPPIDFFSENFVPGEIRDTRTLTYQLKPQTVCPPEELLGRAEQLRNQLYADGGPGTPTPSTLMPPNGPADNSSAVPSPAPLVPQPALVPAAPPTYPSANGPGTTPYPGNVPSPANASPYPVYPSTDGTGGTSVYPLPPGQ